MKKKVNIHCPYCGARGVLRPAVAVGLGAHIPDGYVYVCARYPFCDTYVLAHRDTMQPMGMMADRKLRSSRIKAHEALARLWNRGLMSKKEAYRWLQMSMGLPEDMAHIGQFSDYRCNELIQMCGEFLDKAGGAAA